MKLTELVEEGFKYVARDQDGDLYAFLEKPGKLIKVWVSCGIHRLVNKPELDFIKWEDEEPYNIADLIRGKQK